MRTPPILDEITFRAVLAAMGRAKREGATVPEVLNRAGLLWTPDRERRLRADTIAFILEELKSWHPHEYVRKVNKGLEAATPTDMYMGISKWLEEHLAAARNPA